MEQATQNPVNPQMDISFKLANVFAMSGWLCIMLLPSWANTPTLVLYLSFILLACLYIFLLQDAIRHPSPIQGDKPSFSTLKGVLALLKDPKGALAAWVHILAFDLMIGLYIHSEGTALNISHWLLFPCYVFTLMFGPIGLLMFLGLKFYMGL